MTTEETHLELLKAVKAIKGQVIHRDSLSVGIDLTKPQRTIISQVKTVDQTREEMLKTLRRDVGDCQLCPLGKTRKNLVFGVGNPEAQIVFVGEAPWRR